MIHKYIITFDLKDPDTLTEKHIKVDDPTDVETYEYRRDGDYLVMGWRVNIVAATLALKHNQSGPLVGDIKGNHFKSEKFRPTFGYEMEPNHHLKRTRCHK
uniref:DUF2958 domain-containing protein n=1 Tax=Ascaris lumbricoides TaxID=6252 RepID=A0A0M3I9D5_ASCLU